MLCNQVYLVDVSSKMTDESKANLGRKHTKEELAKMSKAQKGNKNALGCKRSEKFKTFYSKIIQKEKEGH